MWALLFSSILEFFVTRLHSLRVKSMCCFNWPVKVETILYVAIQTILSFMPWKSIKSKPCLDQKDAEHLTIPFFYLCIHIYYTVFGNKGVLFGFKLRCHYQQRLNPHEKFSKSLNLLKHLFHFQMCIKLQVLPFADKIKFVHKTYLTIIFFM